MGKKNYVEKGNNKKIQFKYIIFKFYDTMTWHTRNLRLKWNLEYIVLNNSRIKPRICKNLI